MTDGSADEPVTYEVRLTEAAEAEVETAYFWYLGRSPEGATRWYAGLMRALDSLQQFPRRCQLARESERFSAEVRQLIYGSGRSAYRILFRVYEAEATDPALVRILHVRHAMRRAIGEG